MAIYLLVGYLSHGFVATDAEIATECRIFCIGRRFSLMYAVFFILALLPLSRSISAFPRKEERRGASSISLRSYSYDDVYSYFTVAVARKVEWSY